MARLKNALTSDRVMIVNWNGFARDYVALWRLGTPVTTNPDGYRFASSFSKAVCFCVSLAVGTQDAGGRCSHIPLLGFLEVSGWLFSFL